MASDDILRVGQGREKVTKSELEKFLKSHNLNSLDDLPVCKICGHRKVHFRVRDDIIFDTCGANGKCSHSEYRKNLEIRKAELPFVTCHGRYTEKQLEDFLQYYNLSSLEERPKCNICNYRPVYVNVAKLCMGTTCDKYGCTHNKRSNSAHKAGKKRVEEGRWINPMSTLSSEKRKEVSKKSNETRLNNLRSKGGDEAIHEYFSKLSNSQTPECRSKAASKSNKTRWIKGNHNFQMSPEKLSEVRRKGVITRIRKGDISNIVSKIECECYDYLKSVFDPELSQQYLINGLDHPYDMYSPKYNCLIEFDGDFWHRNKQDIDARYNEIAINNGYKIYRIKECDYRASKESVLKSLEEFINAK